MTVYINEKSMAEIIKFNRKKAGLTQAELADLAGVGKTLIFDLEKERANARFDNLLRIFRVLNIKLFAEVVE